MLPQSAQTSRWPRTQNLSRRRSQNPPPFTKPAVISLIPISSSLPFFSYVSSQPASSTLLSLLLPERPPKVANGTILKARVRTAAQLGPVPVERHGKRPKLLRQHHPTREVWRQAAPVYVHARAW